MTPLAEPFTRYLLYDIIRVLLAPAALILCALIARLAVRRWRARHTDPDRYRHQTHPAVMVSYAVMLFFMAVKRVDNLGTPFTWYVVPSAVAIVLGYVGVLARINMNWPWRRR